MDMSFTDAELRRCQDFIVKVAIDAGRIISSGFSADRKSFAEKSSEHDLVTETDAAVEKFVIAAISDKFPTHRFIGEEATAELPHDPLSHLTDEPTWMIDPIDGTMNFVHSNPNICLSIGMLVSKVPILGVIYNPIMNELYSARINGGAYLNGQHIKVSQPLDMSRALLLTEFGTVTSCLHEKQKIVAKITQKLHGIRATGSAALNMAMVARGAADINYEFGLHCWDMAAGTVIVREAGGVVMDTTGGELDLMGRQVLCANSSNLAHQLTAHLDSHSFNFARD